MDSAVSGASTAGRPSRRRLALRGAVGLVVLLLAVAGGVVWWEVFRDRQPPVHGEIDDDALPSVRLCVRSVTPPCRPVEMVERMIRSDDLEIHGAEQTSGGNQGVIALALRAGDGPLFKAKWRPLESASLFNVPAKELAAYEVQRLLLEPADYVVPPVSGHCFELEHYREQVLEGAAPLPGTSCVLGFLSYWLREAIRLPDARREGLWPTPPEGPDHDDPQLFDEARFADDPAYRRNVAVVNLVAHLVNNRDAHSGQFVLYDEPWHVFLIDNSLAFRAPLPNPKTLFIQDLSQLVVPAIPEDVAARIRALERRELDALRVIEEYTLRDGRLVRVPPGAPFGDEHVRREGERLQIGLSAADVDEVWRRIESTRRALAEGSLRTF